MPGAETASVGIAAQWAQHLVTRLIGPSVRDYRRTRTAGGQRSLRLTNTAHAAAGPSPAGRPVHVPTQNQRRQYRFKDEDAQRRRPRPEQDTRRNREGEPACEVQPPVDVRRAVPALRSSGPTQQPRASCPAVQRR